jgi:manganese transport protein
LLSRGWSPTETLFVAALVSAVLVFVILALDLAGYQWLERGIMAFVGIIGLCYGFEVFLVHPDWKLAAFHTLVPTLDPRDMHGSLYAAVGMLGATVMPHVVYLHSALVQPRREEMVKLPRIDGYSRRKNYLRFELIDVFVAMNGAWLINSAMIVMAAVAFVHGGAAPDIEQAYHTLGPLLGPLSATVFAVALLCSGLSSSTVGVMAGQVIIEGFLDIKFSIFLRRLITIIPALIVIAVGLDPLKILILSQVVLSFALPFALIPLLVLTSRASVMRSFASARQTRVAGWCAVGIILTLNVVLLGQIALGL